MKEMKNPKGNVSRRDFLRLGGLSAGAAVLAACSSGGGGAEEAAEETTAEETAAEETTSEEVAPAAEGKEINWWYAWGNFTPAVEKMAELGSVKEHLGSDTLVWRDNVSQEEFLTAFAAGEPPDGGSNTDYPGFWARGVAIPVDDLVAGSSIIDLNDMTPALVEGAKYDGQMIGVIGIESYIWWGLNYNAQHVEEAGLDPDNPPQTFEDLLEWHKALTQFDSAGNLVRLGIDPYDAMAGEPDFPAFSHGLRWWNDEEHTFHLDDPRMAEAANTFGEFYRFAGPDNMAGMRSVEGQGTWGAAYNAEVQSMIIEGYWHPGETQIQKPEVAQHNRATWAPVPASRAGTKVMATGPHYVQLYKDGQNVEGMFKMSEMLHTNEVLDIIFAEVGWLTGKTSYLQNVDADAFPGLRFYVDAVSEVDEWLVGRRSPIHWYVAGQWDELKEQVYRDLMSPTDAVAELQKRAVAEWEAQGLS
ncbi:MAG: extracellular solute-binding protein [Anaerolineales bacterium]|nr:extracellular solute-binding protein [Anaerolineales bacterium]